MHTSFSGIDDRPCDEPGGDEAAPDGAGVVLLVEDSEADHEAVQRALRRSRPDLVLEWCATGEQARERLGAVDRPRPRLLLLDLNMTDVDGREVLMAVKADSSLRQVPVVVLTTSTRPQDVEACYALGARGYVVKPVVFSQLQDALADAVDQWVPGPG